VITITMKTITAKEFYSGYDPGTEHDFTLQEGESIEVSDEKFEQLKRDGLLERFEVGKAKASKSSTSTDDGLDDLKRPALDKRATELGLDPSEIKKIGDLRAAIRAKVAAGPSDGLDDLDHEQLVARAGEIGLADPADLDDDELRAGIRSAAGGHEGTQAA
jgi:hypothetical protein